MKNSIYLLLTAVLLSASAQRAEAGPFGSAIGGAIGGSLIGGLLGGEEGADIGATLGGIGGLARGVHRERQSRARAEQSAAYYRRQAEMERYRSSSSRSRYSQYQSRQPSTTVIETQKSLTRLGYDVGEIGSDSNQTREAIKSYQRNNGLLVTGEASQELLRHMLRNGG